MLHNKRICLNKSKITSFVLPFFCIPGIVEAQEMGYENLIGLAKSSFMLIPIIIVPALILYNSKNVNQPQKRRWMPFYLIWTFVPYLGLWIIAYAQDTNQLSIGFNAGLAYMCFAVFSPYVVWAIHARREGKNPQN